MKIFFNIKKIAFFAFIFMAFLFSNTSICSASEENTNNIMHKVFFVGANGHNLSTKAKIKPVSENTEGEAIGETGYQVADGDAFEFRVYPKRGYESSKTDESLLSVVLKAKNIKGSAICPGEESAVLSEDYFKFSTNSIKSDCIIEIEELTEKEFKVTFGTDPNNISNITSNVNSQDKFTYGDIYNFTLTSDNGYVFDSDFTVTAVYDDGTEPEAEEGEEAEPEVRIDKKINSEDPNSEICSITIYDKTHGALQGSIKITITSGVETGTIPDLSETKYDVIIEDTQINKIEILKNELNIYSYSESPNTFEMVENERVELEIFLKGGYVFNNLVDSVFETNPENHPNINAITTIPTITSEIITSYKVIINGCSDDFNLTFTEDFINSINSVKDKTFKVIFNLPPDVGIDPPENVVEIPYGEKLEFTSTTTDYTFKIFGIYYDGGQAQIENLELNCTVDSKDSKIYSFSPDIENTKSDKFFVYTEKLYSIKVSAEKGDILDFFKDESCADADSIDITQQRIEHGKDFTCWIKLSEDSEYDFTNAYFEAPEDMNITSTPSEDGKIIKMELKNVTSNADITIKDIGRANYTVKFVTDNDISLSSDIIQITAKNTEDFSKDSAEYEWTTIKENTTFEFKYSLSDAYSNSTISMTPSNGILEDDSLISPDDPTYSLKLTRENSEYTITISGLELNKYKVNIEADTEDYTLRLQVYESEDFSDPVTINSIEAEHGESCTYWIGLDNSNTEFPFLTFGDNTSITLNETSIGFDRVDKKIKITLSEVTSESSVKIPGIEVQSYEIKFVEGNGNSLDISKIQIYEKTIESPGEKELKDNTAKIQGEKPIIFIFKMGTGYTKCASELGVSSENGVVDINNEEYEITYTPQRGVEYQEIKVQGIEVNKYNIKFKSESLLKEHIKITAPDYTDSDSKSLENDVEYSDAVVHSFDDSSPNKFKFTLSTSDDYEFDFEELKKCFTGLSGLTFNLNKVSERQIEVTLSNITNDIGPINILGISSSYCDISFIEKGEESVKSVKIDEVLFENGKYVKGRTNIQISGGEGEEIKSKKGSDFIFGVSPQKGNGLEQNFSQLKVLKGDVVMNSSDDITVDGSDNPIIYFKITNIKENDITIEVNTSAITKNKYNVSFNERFENDQVKVYNKANENPLEKIIQVSHDDLLELKVKIEKNYCDKDTISISVTPEDSGVTSTLNYEFLDDDEEGNMILKTAEYTVKDNASIQMKFDATNENIVLKPHEGITYYQCDQITGKIPDPSNPQVIFGTWQVVKNTSFTFAVGANEGYDLSTLNCFSNNKSETVEEPLQSDNQNFRIFRINNVDVEHNVTVTINKIKYNVIIPELVDIEKEDNNISGVTFLENSRVLARGSSLSVDHGSHFSFKIEIDPKYNQSSLTFRANGDIIHPNNGVYTVSNIKGTVNLSFGVLTKNKYNVKLTPTAGISYIRVPILDGTETDEASEGAPISGGSFTVEHSESFEFKIATESAAYSIGEDTVVMIKHGDGIKGEIEPNESGVYVINNILDDKVITVENVEEVYLSGTFKQTTGVTYLNDRGQTLAVDPSKINVKYNNILEFSLLIDEEYDESVPTPIVTSANEITCQKLSSTRWVLSNITSDFTVAVSNVNKNKYSVYLTPVTGVEYRNESNAAISEYQFIEHKDDFRFKLNLFSDYKNSKLKVMNGLEELTADSSGLYVMKGIIENKVITIGGVEESKKAELTNMINKLPSSLRDYSDVEEIISVTKAYYQLPIDERNSLDADRLLALQEEAKKWHHNADDIQANNLDWHIKLMVTPITSDMEACQRIYSKLSSEFILSLNDVYFYDTLNNRRYKIPEGHLVTISIPTPDMTYFEKPIGIHETEDNKIEFLSLSINNKTTSFNVTSTSPMGIVANRSNASGRSSLLDAFDANVQGIVDYADYVLNTSSNKKSAFSDGGYSDLGDKDIEEENTGNKIEKFSEITTTGNIMRLLLLIVISTIVVICVIIFVKNRDKKSKDNSKKEE